MEIFLAKSDGETIVKHTEKLLENFETLFQIYPKINVDKKLLLLACIFHDLGKINSKFQYKISSRKQRKIIGNENYESLKDSEIPHGVLSTAFIDNKILSINGFEKNDIKALAYAVALHHERNLSEIEEEDLKKEIELMEANAQYFIEDLKKLESEYFETIKKYYKEIFEYSIFKIENDNIKLKKLSRKYYKLKDRIYSKEMHVPDEEAYEIFKKYIMVKGLLNKIDYAASAYTAIEEKNDFLEMEMENFLVNVLKKDNPENDWNELQKFMIKNREENIIVVAQTGYGKTEAGLLWIGDNKGFFTLPLRAAINSIYERIRKDIVKENIEKRVGLLHSDFREIYIENEEKLQNNKSEDEKSKNRELSEYMNKTRQLSLPLTICTIDQLFDFVFRAPGFEVKVATLSYSKVVIDEIQMYDSRLLAYLIFGLKYITDFGGKFVIMTATLPGIIPYLLNKEEVKYVTTKPFTNNKKRHCVKVFSESISAEFILNKYKENKVLVVCNTVTKSKEIYENLKELGITSNEMNLIHSRFIKKDRSKKEEEISKFANPKRFREDMKTKRIEEKYDENGIWIGTQVLEASLDLDFDILITELSDLNGLFQRMGRCYRNREISDKNYNCYVFTKECSGIGGSRPVIDKEIHEKSKEALKNFDGVLTENKKLDLIEKVYSYESLKNTKYFKAVEDNVYALKNYIVEYEKNKAEIQKIFRNIASYDVIPKIIYENNKGKFHENIKILSEDTKGLTDNEKTDLRFEKIRARSELNQFKVAIYEHEYRALRNSMQTEIEVIKVNKYEELIIVNCNYSYEKGIEFLKKEKNFDEDNMF